MKHKIEFGKIYNHLGNYLIPLSYVSERKVVEYECIGRIGVFACPIDIFAKYIGLTSGPQKDN